MIGLIDVPHVDSEIISLFSQEMKTLVGGDAVHISRGPCKDMPCLVSSRSWRSCGRRHACCLRLVQKHYCYYTNRN